jgi:GT2 family glycosyltransferase
VDNGSGDGTQDYLRGLEPEHPEIKVILSETNLGFAAGNNLGLAVATGDYLVLLNNDTIATDGWAFTLMRHLQRDPQIGIIGPVTDNIGNEARIELQYSDPGQMHEAARRFTLARIGGTFAMRTLAFFCVMLPRRTYERCGPICTDYGMGFFEDDDYFRRIEKEGWTIRCAEDVFIHHHLSASFSKLSQAERDRLFEANRAIYEKKWGPWVPHRYR